MYSVQNCKVNILGTEYSIFFREEKDDSKLKNCDGYMDGSVKKIVVGVFESDEMSLENLEDYSKKVLRHEIIHAFLYESGLWNNSETVDNWGRSEEITDWIALQFPKMLRVFNEVGAL